MSKDDQPRPERLEALRQRFQEQSRRAQAYYTAMHAMSKVAGSEEAASAWMEQASVDFGGKTPAELVNEGRAEEVLSHISSLSPR